MCRQGLTQRVLMTSYIDSNPLFPSFPPPYNIFSIPLLLSLLTVSNPRRAAKKPGWADDATDRQIKSSNANRLARAVSSAGLRLALGLGPGPVFSVKDEEESVVVPASMYLTTGGGGRVGVGKKM